MSQPSSQCKRAFESFARTGGTFRFDPLEHTVRPGADSSAMAPKQAEKLVVQKLLQQDKERRDFGTRANDRLAPWIPPNYEMPHGVPVAQTTTTAGNVDCTGLSQKLRFDTPPPPDEKHGPPPSPRSPSGDVPLDELTLSGLPYDALVEAVTAPTNMNLAQMVEEGELVEAELKKRKLMNDELEKQVARTKEIYAQHKNICATMRAEVPIIQTQAQTDLQAVRDVVVQYDETVKEILMKKWRLDEVQRDEAPPFAKADAQPLPLKLDALDLTPYGRGPTDAAFELAYEHPLETDPYDPSPFESFDRTREIKRAIEDFRKTKTDSRKCPWCSRPIQSVCNLINHVNSPRCFAANKPTSAELAKLKTDQ